MDAAQLRPLGVGEVLDAALKIYRNRFGTMVRAVALVVIPVQVLGVLIQLSLPDHSSTKVTTVGVTRRAVDTSQFWTIIAASLVVAIAGLVAGVLAQAACLKTVSDTYLDTPSDWRASLRFGLSRLGSLLWLTLLSTLGIGAGILTCGIASVWLYVSWAVAVPVLLVEGLRGRKALGRSYRLVKGRWWPTFGVLILSTLLASVVAGGLGLLLVPIVLAGNDNQLVTSLANGAATAVSSLLTTPFTAAVVAVLYFDLRVRKEGFDLQLLAQRVGVTPPAEGFAPTDMPWSSRPNAGWGPLAGTPESAPPPGWGPPPAPPPDDAPPHDAVPPVPPWATPPADDDPAP